MQRLYRTDRYAARGSLFLAAALLLTACSEGADEPPERDVDDPAAGNLDATVTRDTGGDLDAGARSGRDASTSPSRADAGTRPDADATDEGGGDTCGDVTAADHPAFEAIKKLATTDDEVRVLVYGQSISEQAWWQDAKRWLERTYPSGKLVMEEHARGGCPAQCLIGHERWFSDGQQYNRMPEDVFAWKPDLVIFHVFGDHSDYGYVMRGLKEGCAAFDDYKTFDGKQVPQVRCTDAQRAMSAGYRAPEVLVQNDFVKPGTNTSCPADPGPGNWDCYMNEKIIPEQVAKYGYRLQDNFNAWRPYAADHGIDPAATIDPDDTHLSEPVGTGLMFELTVPHLCYVP